MSELSFEQMLDESFKTIRNGEVVEGTVIDVKPVSYTHLNRACNRIKRGSGYSCRDAYPLHIRRRIHDLFKSS